ncbi:MAG: DNA primase DnaG [Candidatus Nanohaloarchaea archaeon]
MSKVAQSSAKYVIEAELESSGLVEKPDIVGAIFGQTEGLLGDDLDLRELQERGRIGRIQVEVDKSGGSSSATITIPSSLDAADTSLIAASLETIERVGPTNADIQVNEIRDERVSKRDYIVKRAKQLLEDLNDDTPSRGKINEEVKQEVRAAEISEFEGFEAGPEARNSEEIVLVEGRADLVELLKNGVKNAVAIGGTDVPSRIANLTSGREVTAFLDGDRGGDLILEELKQKADVDHVARAPEDTEVEDLEKKQIFRALRDKKSPERAEAGDAELEIDEERVEEIRELLGELVGTRAVHVVDDELEISQKVPVDRLDDVEDGCHAILIDGEIDQERVRKAEELDADYIAGMDRSGRATSSDVHLVTRNEVAEV